MGCPGTNIGIVSEYFVNRIATMWYMMYILIAEKFVFDILGKGRQTT